MSSCGSRSQAPASTGGIADGIPELTEKDFDLQNGTLNKPGKCVVFWAMQWCGFCRTTKPEFKKYIDAGGHGYVVDGEKNKGILQAISSEPQKWGFKLQGFPTIT